MTFAAIETSVDNGQPLELLEVSYLTNHWYYTTTDHSVTHNGNVYAPMPMSHSPIVPSADVAKAQITIKVPQDCPVGDMFRAQPPSGVVTVAIFAKHVSDIEVKTIWMGRIVNSEWNQPWLNLTSESVVSSLQRLGLRRKYGAQCQHALYSMGNGLCNVDKALYKVSYSVTSITGATVNCVGAASRPADYFAGGFVEWVHATSGYLERRMVKSSDVSGNLVLTSVPTGLVVGAQLDTYPGCTHLPSVCDTKFNNSLNYGGMPYIPKKNPFNGASLY